MIAVLMVMSEMDISHDKLRQGLIWFGFWLVVMVGFSLVKR
jgi:hypothetical protein